MYPDIPPSMHFSSTSYMALAERATMGVCWLGPSSRRMLAVAMYPSTPGIWISMNITAYFWSAAISHALAPPSAVSTRYPHRDSSLACTRRLISLSSTTRIAPTDDSGMGGCGSSTSAPSPPDAPPGAGGPSSTTPHEEPSEDRPYESSTNAQLSEVREFLRAILESTRTTASMDTEDVESIFHWEVAPSRVKLNAEPAFRGKVRLLRGRAPNDTLGDLVAPAPAGAPNDTLGCLAPPGSSNDSLEGEMKSPIETRNSSLLLPSRSATSAPSYVSLSRTWWLRSPQSQEGGGAGPFRVGSSESMPSRAPPSARPCFRGGRGRYTTRTGIQAVNVDPTPSALVTSTSPPILLTSICEMARPRPVPPYCFEVEESACMNAEKSLF
mmetsp:Transcript_60911/g.193218  ORF Transcript_60911/g.193218 Transcript_60911/m.193218 type:complete len:383 (-) Transcript_60911:712-1860(-)